MLPFLSQVQHEVLEKRRKEKRDALETIKKMKAKSPARQARVSTVDLYYNTILRLLLSLRDFLW